MDPSPPPGPPACHLESGGSQGLLGRRALKETLGTAQREVLRQHCRDPDSGAVERKVPIAEGRPVPEVGLQCRSCGLPQQDASRRVWGGDFLNQGFPITLRVRRRQAAVLALMKDLPC